MNRAAEGRVQDREREPAVDDPDRVVMFFARLAFEHDPAFFDFDQAYVHELGDGRGRNLTFDHQAHRIEAAQSGDDRERRLWVFPANEPLARLLDHLEPARGPSNPANTDRISRPFVVTCMLPGTLRTPATVAPWQTPQFRRGPRKSALVAVGVAGPHDDVGGQAYGDACGAKAHAAGVGASARLIRANRPDRHAVEDRPPHYFAVRIHFDDGP